METVLKELEKRIKLYLDEMELDLVDIEYVKDGGYSFLRIYIEKIEGTTTLDDCAEFSIKIDDIANELINETFMLEVSTPGLERKLKKPKDFIRFLGKKIKLYSTIQINKKKKFEGDLLKFEDDTVIMKDDLSNEIVEIPLSKVKKAHIVYEIENNI